MAVGMAIAERHLNAEFGDELVDHRTWVIAGDGCLMEGVNHEAIGLAGHLKLGRLIVLWDDNQHHHRRQHRPLDQRGHPRALPRDRLARRPTATATTSADIAPRARRGAWPTPRPSLVACRTVIGKGAPNKQGTHNVHGAPLGADEIAATREALGWTAEPFVVPDDILADWRSLGAGGAQARAEWQQRARKRFAQRANSTRRMAGELPAGDDAGKATRRLAAASRRRSPPARPRSWRSRC